MKRHMGLRMVVCKKCNKNIKFYQKKHTPIEGKTIVYCEKCNTEYISQKNLELRIKKRQEKELEERIKRENGYKRVEEINKILVKYYNACNVEKKVGIGKAYENFEIKEYFENNNLGIAKAYIEELHKELHIGNNTGSSLELNTLLTNKKIYMGIIELIDDLDKILKIILKRNIETNYIELLKLLYDLYQETLNLETEATINAEFVRIKNKLKNKLTEANVLKEFINTPIDIIIDPQGAELLLRKFGIESVSEDLEKILEELKEEIELERFEKNLSGENKYIKMREYSELNGFEFEEYLKELFDKLGYVAVGTKLSGDQGADVIVMKDSIKSVVQAKKYGGKVTNKAVQEVVAAKAYYNCERAMVVTTGEFTKSAIELALSNNVELWDRIVLEKKNRRGKFNKKE